MGKEGVELAEAKYWRAVSRGFVSGFHYGLMMRIQAGKSPFGEKGPYEMSEEAERRVRESIKAQQGRLKDQGE